MPVGPGVDASCVSAALPEMRLPTITLSLRLTGGAGDGAAAWLCMVTPGRPLLCSSLSTTTLAQAVVPGNGAKIPTPAPAPGTWKPLCDESLWEMVLSITPKETFAVGITEVAGPWEAMVMPQS